MAEFYPQYFRFKYNGLLFVGCVATKRPMLTSNSDPGHRSRGVFKQVKMTLHLSSSPLSLTKRPSGNGRGPWGLSRSGSGLPSCFSLYIPSHTPGPLPLMDKLHTLLSYPSCTLSSAWSGLSLSLILQGPANTHLLCAVFSDASLALSIPTT